jgi:hypothetical protein
MFLRRLVTASSVVALLSLFSSSAMAQEAPTRQFGDTGQFALSLNHNLLVNEIDLFSGDDEIQGTIFLAQNFSAALAVGIQWLSSSPVNTTSSSSNVIFHVGPRLGYNLRITSFVSFWPQVGIDYRRLDSSTTSTTTIGGVTTSTSQSSTSNAFGVTVLAPFLIHPTQGFFVGAGPAFYADFANSTSSGNSSQDNSKITSVGLTAMIGGAF